MAQGVYSRIMRGVQSMTQRTLVKLTASEYCIGLRTVSFKRKSPRQFLVARDELKKLESDGHLIAQDINCFAVFRRNTRAGTVSISFSWLQSEMFQRLAGYEENVTLPYEAFMRFVRDSLQEGGPTQWSALSVIDNRKPKLVFYDTDRLHECVMNRMVRKKLARFLRVNFQWPGADEISFYRDFVPYSFLFREKCDGKPGITGGVILHMQEDMRKAYYGLHT